MVYFSVGRTADGRVEMIIMLSQLSVIAVVEVGAELGNTDLIGWILLIQLIILLWIFFLFLKNTLNSRNFPDYKNLPWCIVTALQGFLGLGWFNVV